MAFLGVYGPHAVGKTYAFEQLLEWLKDKPYPVTVINGDNSRERYWRNGELIKVKEDSWKGKADEKGVEIDTCVADYKRLYVIETARFDHHRYIAKAYYDYAGGARVILLTCDWEVFRQLLVDRNTKNGTKFNAAYWDQSKLTYEGHDRYIRQAAKWLKPAGVPYEQYSISHDRHEWGVVMERIRYLIEQPLSTWYL